MSQPRGLGTQGLNLLFRNTPTEQTTNEQAGQATLPTRMLQRCQTQPRKHFDETALEELAASIRRQGILQPIIVRPLEEDAEHYEIVAGERRWRAAQRAGLEEVPVIIRKLSENDVLVIALIENLQREDLNPMEEAEAMAQLKEQLNLSQETLAERLGKSRSAVANALRLLQLALPMRRALHSGEITPGHARAILALPAEDLQAQLFDAIVAQHLSVRDAESAVTHWKRYNTLPEAITENAEKPKKTSVAKPELLKNIQSVLRSSVHPKITISGSEQLGRVTIPYDSGEQLAELLHRLGLDTDTPPDAV